jgi:hypothetical protein
VRRKIVKALELGNTKDDAARLAGIKPATFYEWQAKNPEFADAVARACETVMPKLEQIVHGAALDGEWRAALAILERRHSGWKKTVAIEGGDPGKPVQIDAGAELAQVAKKLAALPTEALVKLAKSS